MIKINYKKIIVFLGMGFISWLLEKFLDAFLKYSSPISWLIVGLLLWSLYSTYLAVTFYGRLNKKTSSKNTSTNERFKFTVSSDNSVTADLVVEHVTPAMIREVNQAMNK